MNELRILILTVVKLDRNKKDRFSSLFILYYTNTVE